MPATKAATPIKAPAPNSTRVTPPLGVEEEEGAAVMLGVVPAEPLEPELVGAKMDEMLRVTGLPACRQESS